MMRKSKENLLILKLEYPVIEDRLLKYIDFPSEYLLRKRLELSDEEIVTIRQAYGYYQDTVREVLQMRLEHLRSIRILRLGGTVKL